MEIVFTVLVLLFTVALSNVFFKIFPVSLPLPIIQIVLGAILSLSVFGLHITFNPEVFMLLFIPPLLFLDGWRIPKRNFFQQQKAILAMALGLVIFTVIILGLIIHTLIPGIPLSAAFALTAVLSPTDAVALSGIIDKKQLPENITNLLQGEALMNDASGLVALRFAIAATMTGSFSLPVASISFLFIAIGGIAVGILINWIYGTILRLFNRFSVNDPITQIILVTLLPFVSYLLAEHIGVSGILAAVSAGIAQSYNKFNTNSMLQFRLQSASIWETQDVIFNGMVFILLGLQLPSIIGHLPNMAEAGAINTIWSPFIYVFFIGVTLLALRYIWVWLLYKIMQRKNTTHKQNIKILKCELGILTLAGVRGAVTLAGVLSIPIYMGDTQLFPQRDLLIFLAAAIIIFSLIGAIIGLPILLKQLPREENNNPAILQKITRQRVNAAIKAIEQCKIELCLKESGQLSQDIIEEICSNIITTYKRRMNIFANDNEISTINQDITRITQNIKLKALRAERNELYKQNRYHIISDSLLHIQLQEIDLEEMALIKRQQQ